MSVSYDFKGNRKIRKLMNKIRSFDQSPKIVTKNYITTNAGSWYICRDTRELYQSTTFTINTDDWRYYCKDREGHFKAVIEDLEWYLMTRSKK